MDPAAENDALTLKWAEAFGQAFPNSMFVRLTPTMWKKSTIDASEPIRQMFVEAGLHDYSQQGQGPEAKVTVPTVIVDPAPGRDAKVESRTSLYRPDAKEGDPRFWVWSLKEYADPGDLLAVGVVGSDGLVAVNLDRIRSEAHWSSVEELLISEAGDQRGYEDPTLRRLLSALSRVSAAGPMPAVCEGDTAVGATMEAALGLTINSSKDPDWEGLIELKFGRNRPGRRSNLLALVPDWSKSPLKSSAEILGEFGYARGAQFKLYVEVDSTPNSVGLFLSADELKGVVRECSTKPSLPVVAEWDLDVLASAITAKHGRTCWVKCQETFVGGVEHFEPIEVRYTAGPRVGLLGRLINVGGITLDHLIKRTPTGGAKEKGPLWKVKSGSAGLLLPLQAEYALAGGDVRSLN